jgi:plasmid maintenance system antidote protein VapI
MKKEETITELLGTCQNEAAMLLNINRSQWSMFVSGKRDLPLEAKEQLAEILTYVQSAKAKNAENLLPSQKDETKERLEALLKENQYQQMRADKKVNRLEKKQQAGEAALHLVQYFENHPHKKNNVHRKGSAKHPNQNQKRQTTKSFARFSYPTNKTTGITIRSVFAKSSIGKVTLMKKLITHNSNLLFLNHFACYFNLILLAFHFFITNIRKQVLYFIEFYSGKRDEIFDFYQSQIAFL